jgi:hypothetical protein
MSRKGIQRLSSTEALNWLRRENAKYIRPTMTEALAELRLDLNGQVQVDHTLPNSFGGPDHPYNYFLLPARVNSSFNKYLTPEKLAWIGRPVTQEAMNFLQYMKAEAQDKLDLNGWHNNRIDMA